MSEAPKSMNDRIREAKQSKQGASVTLSTSTQSDTSRKFGHWLRGEPTEDAQPAKATGQEREAE